MMTAPPRFRQTRWGLLVPAPGRSVNFSECWRRNSMTSSASRAPVQATRASVLGTPVGFMLRATLEARVAGNVPAQVPGDDPPLYVGRTAHRVVDDKRDPLTLVKLRLGSAGDCRQNDQRGRDGQIHWLFHPPSISRVLWSAPRRGPGLWHVHGVRNSSGKSRGGMARVPLNRLFNVLPRGRADSRATPRTVASRFVPLRHPGPVISPTSSSRAHSSPHTSLGASSTVATPSHLDCRAIPHCLTEIAPLA